MGRPGVQPGCGKRVGEPASKAKAVEQYKHWPNKCESADLVCRLDVARMGEPDSKVKAVEQYDLNSEPDGKARAVEQYELGWFRVNPDRPVEQ